MIDLDDIEPDWQLAKVHAKSTIAGRAEGKLQEVQRCPCCFRKIINEPIGMCQNSKELEVLGFGYPLYLKFLKYAMILVFFQICSYNLLQFYNGIQANSTYCQGLELAEYGPVCEIFFVQIASLSHDIPGTEILIRVGSFIIQLYFLIYIRNNIKNTLAYYKERRTSISSYSILIKDLPVVPNIRAKIQKIFSQYFSLSIKIEEIMLIGFLQEYYHLRHRKKELLGKKTALMTNIVVDNMQMSLINQELQQIQTLIEEEVEKTISMTKSDELLCQKIIVIVESEQIKDKVIKEYQKNRKDPGKTQQLKLILGSPKVTNILFREAPEPEEIIWQHINVPRQKRRMKQILGWVFTFLFMAAITAVFYFIIKQKSLMVEHEVQILEEEKAKGEALDDHGLQAKVIAIVYALIFFVVLLNKFVISKFLHFISDFQKHPTYSKEEYYFSIKYTIALFLTTAVLTILVEDVTLNNIYRQNYGIVEEESIMFLVNSFFVPFLWLVNPLQIYRVIKRKLHYGRQHLTQRQANNLMMDEPASLGKLFAQTIEIIWFTYMYSSVIPMGALCVFLGFVCNYWIAKYNILKRSSIEHQVSGHFITMALNLLDISLIMKPAGELLFDYQIRQGYTIQSIICTVLGVIYCLLPTNRILNSVHKEQFFLQAKTYKEVKHTFATNYQMLHPIYSLKKIYVEHYIQRLKFYRSQSQPVHERKMTKKIPINIELALARRSSAVRDVNIPIITTEVIREDIDLFATPYATDIKQRFL